MCSSLLRPDIDISICVCICICILRGKTDGFNVQELTEAEIEIYQFPDCDSDEDDDFKEQNEKLKHSLPFALVGDGCPHILIMNSSFQKVGASTVLDIGGRKVRGRQVRKSHCKIDNAIPHPPSSPRASQKVRMERLTIQSTGLVGATRTRIQPIIKPFCTFCHFPVSLYCVG